MKLIIQPFADTLWQRCGEGDVLLEIRSSSSASQHLRRERSRRRPESNRLLKGVLRTQTRIMSQVRIKDGHKKNQGWRRERMEYVEGATRESLEHWSGSRGSPLARVAP
ncbi:hypothetical protein ColTof3_14882 [Colletotrichum tofieldiae]|nr:hypothetical protein ColTof3_14882 [Colletotrichum tofieldiae]